MYYIQIIHGLFNKSKYPIGTSRTVTGLKEWGGYSPGSNVGTGGVATSIFNQPRGGRMLKSTDKSKIGASTHRKDLPASLTRCWVEFFLNLTGMLYNLEVVQYRFQLWSTLIVPIYVAAFVYPRHEVVEGNSIWTKHKNGGVIEIREAASLTYWLNWVKSINMYTDVSE